MNQNDDDEREEDDEVLEQEVDRHSVLKRVDDWQTRLNSLYRQISDWGSEKGFASSTTGHTTMHEELMRKFDVGPVRLKILDLRHATNDEITFKPYGLWIVGGNGRIDVFKGAKYWVLIDRAERYRSPEWVLYSKESPSEPQRFSKTTFFQMLAS
jgi:hypothetical protein